MLIFLYLDRKEGEMTVSLQTLLGFLLFGFVFYSIEAGDDCLYSQRTSNSTVFKVYKTMRWLIAPACLLGALYFWTVK